LLEQHIMSSSWQTLIVDDDVACRELYRDILELHGYAVTEAHDGVQALGRCVLERPHVIVSDREMPFMSGLELADTLAKDPRLATIPMVLITGTEVLWQTHPNIVACLTKPFGRRALITAIESCLVPARNRGVCA
jgi:CheY-like chemotaxis protein